MTLDMMDGDLWQWDTGRRVAVEGADEVHFSKHPGGPCYTAAVLDGSAPVPDVLLQTAGALHAWAYEPDGAGGRTRVQASWPVARRARPEGYAATPWAQRTIADAERARDEARGWAGLAESARDEALASEVKGARAVTLEPGAQATARMDGNVLEVGVPRGERGGCDFATFTVEGGDLMAHYASDTPNIIFELNDRGELEVGLRDE